MTKDTEWYIKQISHMSNKFGDKLIDLMDEYNVASLRPITLEQAKTFYEKLINDETVDVTKGI